MITVERAPKAGLTGKSLVAAMHRPGREPATPNLITEVPPWRCTRPSVLGVRARGLGRRRGSRCGRRHGYVVRLGLGVSRHGRGRHAGTARAVVGQSQNARGRYLGRPLFQRWTHFVDELIAAIDAWVAERNTDPNPFKWTAKADTILEKNERARRALENAVATGTK
jgi:hypothetical protein